MTTPAQPDAAPRHARQRARPAAAARNRQAAQAARPKPAPKAGPPQAMAAEYAGQKAAQGARSAARTVSQARIPGNRAYQPVLLAEFLAAVVIIALVPIAAGGSANAKAKGTPSPYDTGDLKQIVAVGGLYFILALASSGNSGRISAWFGGLVLLGLAFSKLSHGQLQDVFKTVSGQSAQQDQAPQQGLSVVMSHCGIR